ncbi:MAG: hypothetical protein AAGF36_00235 [Pseudomonadota bacterium]
MTLSQRFAAFLTQISAPHGAMAQTQAIAALPEADLKARGLKHRDAAWHLIANGDWS